LADRRSQVYQTSARRKWMYAVVLDLPEVANRYQAIFKLRRSASGTPRSTRPRTGRGKRLPRRCGTTEPNVLGRVGFLLLAGQVFQGIKVSTRL
jgi:hypothetical protein